ncbi:MAG: hypothetical protein KatS3mg106_012 [Gemmataceae bacterium]|jgi:hypothetical protein|nr:MAG: hypothetical protein KatS3mg106_012 [Gemmataceae bacterium]
MNKKNPSAWVEETECRRFRRRVQANLILGHLRSRDWELPERHQPRKASETYLVSK